MNDLPSSQSSDQPPDVTVPIGLSEITSIIVIIGGILASTGLHRDFGLTAHAADYAPWVVALVTASMTLARAIKHRGAMAANAQVLSDHIYNNGGVPVVPAPSAPAEPVMREQGTVTPPESWTAPAPAAQSWSQMSMPARVGPVLLVDEPPAGPSGSVPLTVPGAPDIQVVPTIPVIPNQ